MALPTHRNAASPERLTPLELTRPGEDNTLVSDKGTKRACAGKLRPLRLHHQTHMPFRDEQREAFGVREQGLFAPALVGCALWQALAKATAACGRSRTPNASRGSNAAGMGQRWLQNSVFGESDSALAAVALQTLRAIAV